MPERNSPACPLHGDLPRARSPHNFFGIVSVISDLIETVSGVGTSSYTRCPFGYPANFEGVVRALEDLNATTSGITAGTPGTIISGVLAGSGVYVTTSGDFSIINSAITQVFPGSGISTVASGTGLYEGGQIFDVITRGVDGVSTSYDGDIIVIDGSGVDVSARVTVSGSPGENYGAGALWFDINEGRLFVYASGNNVSDPDWYQTNAEALAIVSEVPPSGNGGLNAPPLDGSLWFNRLMGNLFVYDETSSGWYETAPAYTPAYGSSRPIGVVEGATFVDNTTNEFLYWDGSDWEALGADAASGAAALELAVDALASGNSALLSAQTAQASGNAGIVLGLDALASGANAVSEGQTIGLIFALA